MDYQLEAYNTMTFKKHMAGLEGVKVATVFPELTSRKVRAHYRHYRIRLAG